MSFNPKVGIITSRSKIARGEVSNLTKLTKTELNFFRKNGEYVIIDQSVSDTSYPDRVTFPKQKWERTKIWVFYTIEDVCSHVGEYYSWEIFFINTFEQGSNEWEIISRAIRSMKRSRFR